MASSTNIQSDAAKQAVQTTLNQIKRQSRLLSPKEQESFSKNVGAAQVVKTVSRQEARSYIDKNTGALLQSSSSNLIKSQSKVRTPTKATTPKVRIDAPTAPQSPYEYRQLPTTYLTAMHRYGLGPAFGEDLDIARAGGPVNWLRQQTMQPLDFGTDYRTTSDMLDIYEARHALGGFTTPSWNMFWGAYTEEWGKVMRDAVTTRMPFAFAWGQFWFNHFGTIHKMDNLNRPSAKLGLLGTSFLKDAIYPNMFGKFEDLLLATFNNAAMPFHLDGITDGRNPNQNYARELLELHTVGNDPSNYPAGYPVYNTQTIQELSYILSGRIVRMTPFAGDAQQPAGPRGTIGVSRGRHAHPGGTATSDPLPYLGRPFDLRPFLDYTLAAYPVDNNYIQWHIIDQQQRVIRMIANHPAVGINIIKKMIHFFVGDVGMERGTSRNLINALYAVWQTTQGNLGEVARALVSYDGVLTINNMYIPKKFKNPQRYVIAALRSSGLFSLHGGANTASVTLTPSQQSMLQTALFDYLHKLSMRFGYAPDVRGYLLHNNNWKTPQGMLQRLLIASEIGALIQGSETARSMYNRTIATIRLNFSRSASILNLPANKHTALLVSEEFLQH